MNESSDKRIGQSSETNWQPGQEGFVEESRQSTGKEPRLHTDLTTVESQRNDIVPEEFPEGPYGTSILSEGLGKSTPWREDQRPLSAFTYENRELHEGLDRDYPGDHEQ